MRQDWNWANIYGVILVAIILTFLGLGIYAIPQDHSVKFYFLSGSGTSSGRNGYCVEGYRDWWPNEYSVFCSDDIEKTVAVTKQMNDSLVRRSK